MLPLFKLFFPVFMVVASILGVESVNPASQLARIESVNPGFVRWNGVRWPDQVDHTQLAALNNLETTKVIVVVQTTEFIPTTIQQYQIGMYIKNLAIQYPHIYAWELWNEPDRPAFYGSSYFLGGGWNTDARGYGAFLSRVKYLNPENTILSGGLCEANVSWVSTMLIYAGKPDGISFHSYATYPYANTLDIQNKVVRLRSLTTIPLYLTETALKVSDPAPADFDAKKAEYLQAVFTTATDLNLWSAIWYTVGGNGWMNTDLEGLSYDLFRELTKAQ